MAHMIKKSMQAQKEKYTKTATTIWGRGQDQNKGTEKREIKEDRLVGSLLGKEVCGGIKFIESVENKNKEKRMRCGQRT